MVRTGGLAQSWSPISQLACRVIWTRIRTGPCFDSPLHQWSLVAVSNSASASCVNEGFASRAQWNRDQLQRLVDETNVPDVICLQEVRLKARSPDNRGEPLQSEYDEHLQHAMEDVFAEYQPFWSLADQRYSGTLTLIHKRVVQPQFVAFSMESAIDVLLQHFGCTRRQVGLLIEGDEKMNNTPKKSCVKQTKIQSFFAPKSRDNATPAATRLHQSFAHNHHPEGRFQFFCFENADLVQTYVPNNGTKEESFRKREQWDRQMLQFIANRMTILRYVKSERLRPIIWCGDMNVAKEYLDGSHWKIKKTGDIYEWWTDETKCFANDSGDRTVSKHPDNIGIPSFTPAERRRFLEILREGDFLDVWRTLHPLGISSQESKLKYGRGAWEGPNYTWRGHLSRSTNYPAKYQGKGQRLDYFLLSPSSLISSIKSCSILGHGESRDGLFCGSDHCAVSLHLHAALE